MVKVVNPLKAGVVDLQELKTNNPTYIFYECFFTQKYHFRTLIWAWEGCIVQDLKLIGLLNYFTQILVRF